MVARAVSSGSKQMMRAREPCRRQQRELSAIRPYVDYRRVVVRKRGIGVLR